ncbi:hypothetical protein [Pseudooceanicola sp.]|uniref:hypothetical protein n=1 Tax=Pseudooceanicola sp. TaxID=1914328 RepID=UPI002605BCB3|nr:hypothetical protein [Pseudooceanicola sp.]
MSRGHWARRLQSRGRAIALALGLALPGTLAAQPAQTSVTLTLPQARAAALAAAQHGDAETVRLLTFGLKQAGAADGQMHYLLARAEMDLGRPVPALDAARTSYRLAGSKRQRFDAAQLAAAAAQAAGRSTTAQLWLRRVYQNTDNPADRKAIARDYRILRAINPFSFQMAASVAPSSNVNNGSGSQFNIIDGVPLVGVLSPTAQALSGLVYSADLSLGYRLGELRKDRRLTAVARLYTKQVHLSDSARAKAPTARDSDFALILAEAGLRLATSAEDGTRLGGGLIAGQSWYGGSRYFGFFRGEASWSRRLGQSTGIGVAGYFERRDYDASPTTENLAQIGLWASQALPDGSQLGLRLTYVNSNLTGKTRDSHSLSARLDWSPEEKIGPAHLTLGVNASYANYPDYMVGFIVVPGGRQDKTIGVHARAVFDDFGYAGFVPTMDIGLSRTTSNVSRFETRTFSVGFGIRSAF